MVSRGNGMLGVVFSLYYTDHYLQKALQEKRLDKNTRKIGGFLLISDRYQLFPEVMQRILGQPGKHFASQYLFM